MSYREVSMLEIKEVLRRKEAGDGVRKIAREMGIDRKTFGNMFTRRDGAVCSHWMIW